MDGITALPERLAVDPKLTVIMASSLTRRNADINIQALRAEAADYVPKPTSREIAGGQVIAQDEASSVVWGMPGTVTVAGLCSAVASLGDLPSPPRRDPAGRVCRRTPCGTSDQAPTFALRCSPSCTGSRRT